MAFQAPIGSPEEIETGNIWPGRWVDATPYLSSYSQGIHTGADLNLNFPHWDSDRHTAVHAMGDGTVSFARLFSRRYWGNIIVINHGIVEGQPLFSRYGHVENIRVTEGQQVTAGDQIADVGNGEALFPYHLHFDISRTEVLLTQPGHWPGHNRAQVRAHYVDPKDWLQTHRQAVATPRGRRRRTERTILPNIRTLYVIASLGLRVRRDHTTSALQVGSLLYSSPITVELETVDQDSYTWGHITGGMFHGDWVAVGRADQSETFVSSNPPGL